MKKPDPETIDKRNPEWTDSMFAKAKPASEVFPIWLLIQKNASAGSADRKKKPRKVLIALRLKRSTIEAYKAAGKGYQRRMAEVLDKHAK